MDCADVREEFSALLDGELAPDERKAVEAHLAQCAGCLRELERCKQVDTAYRALPRHRAPADFEERVAGALQPNVVRLRRPGLRPRRVWPLLAAAATVLVMLGGVFLQVRSPSRRIDLAQVPAAEGDARGKMEKGTAARGRTPALAEDEQRSEAELGGIAATESTSASFGRESHLVEPPEERFDVAKAEKVEASPRADKPDESPVAQMDPQLRRQLGALGYLSSARGHAPADKDAGDTVAAIQEGAVLHDSAAESDEAVSPVTLQVAEEAAPEPAPLKSMVSKSPDAAHAPEPSPPPASPARVRHRRTPAASPALAAPTVAPEPARGAVAAEAPVSEPAAESTAVAPPPPSAPPIVLGAAVAPAGRSEQVEEVKALGYVARETAEPAASTAMDVALRDDLAVETEEAKGDQTRREAGGRTFELRDGVWRQSDYEDEQSVPLIRGSEELAALVDEYPKLKPLLDVGDRVIFRHNRTWYRVEPAPAGGLVE